MTLCASTLLTVVVVVAAVSGCSSRRQSITFELESARPKHELSYFPIVERGGQIFLARSFKKTADASGYHDAVISPRFPENLATPWRTTGLSDQKRVGIVILERDEQNNPVLSSAKILWLNIDEGAADARDIRITVPDLNSLPKFDVSSLSEE